MSGSSLDGLDIVFTELEEHAGKWSFEIKVADCISYKEDWQYRLQLASSLSARDYLLLHADYGRYVGATVNDFIEKNALHHQVQIISSHGHTVFHEPSKHMTSQLGDGAAIAAATGINVVSDLRAMDVALGGQGAPIVPLGEKLLFPNYSYYLNLGGIANISFNADKYIAFDICPANRVLNMLAEKTGKPYDEDGNIARSGSISTELLSLLNNQEYYKQSPPKSLSNNFGTDIIFPIIESMHLPINDAARTYTEHIVQQITYAINDLRLAESTEMLVTGGGAFNKFLIERLKESLSELHVKVIVPNDDLVKYKEALIMSLLGVLRWREEDTVLSSVTGASRNSIGGAVWIGQEA